MGRLRNILVAWGPLGIFAAAVIESAGVPSPSGTDALILLVTIARPDSALLCAVLAVTGSLIGCTIFHHIVRKGGQKLLDQRTSTGRRARFRAWFMRYGLASVFVCALVPFPFMPLKVMALTACALGVSRARFLGVMLAARIPRYGAMAYLGAKLGENSNAWLKSHLWHMGILSIVLFVALYGLLRFSESREPQPRPTGA
ncbi:MAG: VTT domain-containing protein [Acidobacteriota bacterium]